MTRAGPAATEIIDALDSFYCYNITAALWAEAAINRLEGLAIFLLGDELAEVARRARAAHAGWRTGSAISGVLVVRLAMLYRSPAHMPSMQVVTSGISCRLRLMSTMNAPLAGRVLAPTASDDR